MTLTIINIYLVGCFPKICYRLVVAVRWEAYYAIKVIWDNTSALAISTNY